MEEHSKVSRRGFVRAGAACMLGAAGMSFLGGCAQQQKLATTGKSALVTPMTEEDRFASISDPVYMGAQANASGQVLEIGTGREGQIGNQRLIDKREEFDPQIIKVSERVYVALGHGLPNAACIVGDTGIIVVDSNESNESAQMDLDLIRTVTDKPVVAVIYSHDHYVNGTETYVGEGNPNNIPIIAHEKLVPTMNGKMGETNDALSIRAYIQFGALLPMSGRDAVICEGLGPFFTNPEVKNPTSGFIEPTVLIPDADKAEMTAMTIDGVNIELWPMESDSPASMNIYLPDDKVVISNSMWSCFYNMYTLRGAAYRNPNVLYQSIDTMLTWDLVAHVGVHGQPVIGAEDVYREMALYRDCIQFVYDQTVRFMNKGLGPDEIVESITIPAYMIEGMCTKPLYGEVEHFIRGVYRGIIGWFGTDPLELHPVSKRFESSKIVEAMGGKDAVVDASRAALEDGQYAWAATLASYVVNIAPDDEPARRAKAEAFRKMGQVTASGITRNYYMTNALALEGELSIPTTLPLSPDKLAVANRTLVLDLLRCSIDYEKAIDVEKSLALTYTDEGVSNMMAIRNCVGRIVKGTNEGADVELRLTYPTMCQIMAKAVTLDGAIAAGDVEVVGSAEDLGVIRDLCERKL